MFSGVQQMIAKLTFFNDSRMASSQKAPASISSEKNGFTAWITSGSQVLKAAAIDFERAPDQLKKTLYSPLITHHRYPSRRRASTAGRQHRLGSTFLSGLHRRSLELIAV